MGRSRGVQDEHRRLRTTVTEAPRLAVLGGLVVSTVVLAGGCTSTAQTSPTTTATGVTGHLQPVGKPTTTTRAPTTTIPLPPSPTTTTAPPTTTTSAPSFTAIVGTWSAHDTAGLTIASSGQGTVGFPDFVACPSCSEADAPVNTISFQLTAPESGGGAGMVTSSTDPNGTDENGNVVSGLYAPGSPVLVTPSGGSPGQVVTIAINGQQSRFCDPTARDAGECGA